MQVSQFPLFFLEYTRALRIISLRKSRVQQHSPETKKNKNKNRTEKKRPQETTVKTQESRPYSPETSTPKFLAPALIHRSASARITSSRSVTDVVALRKQRAFLSFHTCQDTKAKRESKPFRWQPCHSLRSCLQADSTEWFGWGRCFPSAV